MFDSFTIPRNHWLWRHTTSPEWKRKEDRSIILYNWYARLEGISEFADETSEISELVLELHGECHTRITFSGGDRRVHVDVFDALKGVVPIIEYVDASADGAGNRVRRRFVKALDIVTDAAGAESEVRNAWCRHFIPYDDYLTTAHWQQVREDALHRARYRCQLCGSRSNLNVHHRDYARRGFEEDEDVTVLCRDCHSVFHEKLCLVSSS